MQSKPASHPTLASDHGVPPCTPTGPDQVLCTYLGWAWEGDLWTSQPATLSHADSATEYFPFLPSESIFICELANSVWFPVRQGSLEAATGRLRSSSLEASWWQEALHSQTSETPTGLEGVMAGGTELWTPTWVEGREVSSGKTRKSIECHFSCP